MKHLETRGLKFCRPPWGGWNAKGMDGNTAQETETVKLGLGGKPKNNYSLTLFIRLY
jgi:hypothetical protein